MKRQNLGAASVDLEAELVSLHILPIPAVRIYRQIHKGFSLPHVRPHGCGQRGTTQTVHALNLSFFYKTSLSMVCTLARRSSICAGGKRGKEVRDVFSTFS